MGSPAVHGIPLLGARPTPAARHGGRAPKGEMGMRNGVPDRGRWRCSRLRGSTRRNGADGRWWGTAPGPDRRSTCVAAWETGYPPLFFGNEFLRFSTHGLLTLETP